MTAGSVDLGVRLGSVDLPNPVMTASGTAGHGDELGRYMDLSSLGAVVVKSLSAEPWEGNPAPRVHETDAGMINSVGLQNPGVEAWREHELPALLATGARVVASIWGFTVEAYEKAAAMLADCPHRVVAVEVNLSCPNLHGVQAHSRHGVEAHSRHGVEAGSGHGVQARSRHGVEAGSGYGGAQMFAQSPEATAEAVGATAVCGRPRWAKLSPNVTDITDVARSALEAGAEGLTLVNTVMGMAIDPASRRFRLGAGGGGLSGPAIRPVAVRAVYECRQAFPGVAIVGVGGVSRGEHAAELMVAGADAVQVGTATLADPRAPARVRDELARWCATHGVARAADLIGTAHERA